MIEEAQEEIEVVGHFFGEILWLVSEIFPRLEAVIAADYM